MPACRDCFQFENGACKLSHGSMKQQLRACSYSMFMKNLPNISGRVLEVGCGVARYVKKNVRRRKAVWTGLDPQCKPSDVLINGTVGDIPFPEGWFDWVVSMASIEHWMEHGDGIYAGLKEIYRVLKPGGRMLIDCPFHIHGADTFLFGDAETVKRVVESLPWSDLAYDEWRRDHAPLPPLRPWDIPREKRKGKLRAMFPPDGPSQWFLEVLATK